MCDCAECEQFLQPYLDRVLSEDEFREAEEHLDGCAYCRRRYVFEAKLRMYVRQVAAAEPMPAELKARLASLRVEL